MPSARVLLPDAPLVTRVRTWFGLTLAELALYVGASRTLLHAVETGQRPLSQALRAALVPLATHLPPPEALTARLRAEAAEADLPPDPVPAPGAPGALGAALLPSPLPPATPPPDVADLDFRRRAARAQAARRLTQAAALAARARVAARWAAALPALLPPDPDADPAHHPAAAAHYAALAAADTALAHLPAEALARARDHGRWLRGWLAHRARPLTAAEATRYHRLRAQATGRLAEAATLAHALAGTLAQAPAEPPGGG